MSQTPTPEALAAADSWLTSTETYLSINPCMDMRTYLALAFDAHTRDLQATIARLTRELGEARAKNYKAFIDGMEAAAQICGSLAETTYDDADAFEAATGCEWAIMRVVNEKRAEQARHEHRKD